MTTEERIIVSAYTGYLMCDFGKVHEYIDKKMGRPVWTHELADDVTIQKIREAIYDDFRSLCEERK